MPGSVALSDSDVFFMVPVDVYESTGKLMRVSKSGGSAVLLAGGIPGPSDLSTVAGSPYWTNPGLFVAGAVTGGSESPFAPPVCQFKGSDSGTVLVDDATVYWFDICGSIWKEPKSGGTPTLIAKNTATSHTGLGHRIALDSKRIYWTDPAAIKAADKSTGAVTTIATLSDALGYQGGIAVDATSVYWTYNDALWCTRKP